MDRIGRYEVLGEVGRGGLGTVHRARGPDGRVVAIKLLRRPDGPGALERFAREQRLQGELGEGDGFVPLLDQGDAPEGPYVVMPFVEGGTLSKRLAGGPLPLEAGLDLGLQLAEALGRAHARGIVHRDLKPDNVLLRDDGRPLVADLGLAKHFLRDAPGAGLTAASLSHDDAFSGTVGYAAPEQMRDAKSVGPQADVFALAAIIYECLAGVPAFPGNAFEALHRVESGEVVPLRHARPDAPPAVARVVERALSSHPAARPRDGEALAAALREARATRGFRGHTALPWVLGLGLAALLVVMAVAVLDPFARRPSAEAAPASTSTAPRDVARIASADRASSAGLPAAQPTWFLALPEAERPALPLPVGLTFGARQGEYVNAADGQALVFVPAGPFLMGTAGEDPSSAPPHEVTLAAFFAGKHEVRVREFAAFVAATGHRTDAEREAKTISKVLAPAGRSWLDAAGATWLKPAGPGGPDAAPDEPVRQVTWDDARAYCAWAGLTLPTEAQWEKLAAWDPRARESRRYPWGHDPPSADSPRRGNLCDESARRAMPRTLVAFDGYDDGFARAAPVDAFPAGASFYGALELAGNVNEWCLDRYDPGFYALSPPVDPLCEVGRAQRSWRGGNFGRVYVGGNWFRGFREGGTCSDTLGFRCVRSAR